MPYSPESPQRRRRSSGFSLTPSSPQSITFTPIRPSHSRKSSVQSLRTPTTPRPPSSHDRTGGFNFSSEFGTSVNAGNGLGSLADELAEAWEEEGEEEGEDDISDIHAEEVCLPTSGLDEAPSLLFQDQYEKDIIGLAILPDLLEKPVETINLQKHITRAKTRRKQTDYKHGLDYAEHSDNEETGIPASLEMRMAVIDALAKQGSALTGTEVSGVFVRVADALMDLTAQTGVESHATRLSTAHTALTSHITHQMRLLQALTHPLLSPIGIPPCAETLDYLLPLIPTLILSLPQAPTTALSSLHALSTSTTDLLLTLSYLSDTLHMARQTTTLAARRLRAAREVVESMRREVEEAEEGMRSIETGGWDERLKGREAARVCGEVVGGFEEVCARWRERLASQSGGGVEVGAG
ncbi:hypothetical protein MMC11_000256 [Xylographa trunciseda]|nr:hypothetical protein [Xylographa trunciseda]